MQQLDWNGLSLILEITRARSLAGAAKRLAIDQTTVSRRLNRFETQTGVSVFKRTRNGVIPTADGERLLEAAKRMERELLLAASQTFTDQTELSGSVSLTCVPLVAVHLIAKPLTDFVNQHPAVEVALLGESRYYRVRDREADIALRFDKPGADHSVLSRKIAAVQYGVYHATGTDPSTLPWLNYTTEMRQLPQTAWIATAIENTDGVLSALRVYDALEMLSLVENGAGKSFLPDFVAKDNVKLTLDCDTSDQQNYSRELWLLVHPSIRTLSHVDALIRSIESGVQQAFKS